MSSGYGTAEFWKGETDEEYGVYNSGKGGGGFDHVSTFAYPNQIIRQLKDSGKEPNVTKLTFEGTRFDEVHAMLSKNSNYYDKQTKQIGEKTYFDQYMKSHTNSWTRERTTARWTENGVDVRFASFDDVRSLSRDRVKNADLVIMDNFNSNFGVYLSSRLMAIAGCLGEEDFSSAFEQTGYANRIEDLGSSKLLNKVTKDVRKKLNGLIKQIKLSGLPAPAIAELVDTLVYTTVDAVWACNQSINDVTRLNPNAKIIVVGPQNLFENEQIKIGGKSINLGSIMKVLLGSLGDYLKILNNDSNIYYLDIIESGQHIETFMEKWSSYNPEDIMKVENVDDYCELLLTFSSEYTDDGKQPNEDIMQAVNASYANNNEKKAAVKAAAATAFSSQDNAVTEEQVDNIVYNLAACSNEKGFDFDYMIKSISSFSAIFNGLEKNLVKKYEELEDAEKTMIKVYVTFLMQSATGVHPSEAGCIAKAALVEKEVAKALGLNKDRAANYNHFDKSVEGAIEKTISIIQLFNLINERPSLVNNISSEHITGTYDIIKTAFDKIARGFRLLLNI